MAALSIPMMHVFWPIIQGGRKFALNLLDERKPRKVRRFGGVEESNVVQATLPVHSRAPLFSLRVPRHANKSGRVIALHSLVRSILAVAGLSQIFNSVVRPISIDVVNLALRMPPVKMKPCKTMRRVSGSATHLNQSVANVANGTSFLTGVTAIPSSRVRGADAPTKDACHWVVVQNLTDKLSRQVGSWRLHKFLHRSRWHEPIMAAMSGQAIVKEH